MRISPIHIVILVVSLPFFSCQKELSYEGGPPPAQEVNGDFRAKIDGVQWVAADSAKGAAILGGLINISGTSSDNKQISMTLNDTVTGVYTLSQVSTSLGAYADQDSSGVYAFTTDQGADTSQAGGTVTVTEIDKVNRTISGTFSFKVYRDLDSREKSITAGIFNKLSYVSALPPASNGDTMQCTINGVPWVGQSIMASILSPALAINGSDLNGSQSVSLIFPLNSIPGSYPMSISGLVYFGIYTPSSTSALSSSSGTLTILQNDAVNRRVRGSFFFDATYPGLNATTDHLTAGYFSVSY
jgi:Family of unknown function (DUF6252)